MSPESQPPFEINLVYAGQLAGEAGVSEETVSLSEPTPLVEILRRVGGRHGGLFEKLLFDDEGQGLRRALVVSVDDTQIAEPQQLVLDADHEVFLMTPIAGG